MKETLKPKIYHLLTEHLRSRNWGNVSVTNTMTLHSGSTLYNGGTITSKDIAINSNTQIINDNKIELEGEFNLPSNFSLENNGEIYGKNDCKLRCCYHKQKYNHF